METLVLDYTYQPIDRVPWRDAVTKWASGLEFIDPTDPTSWVSTKVEIIASYTNRIIHAGMDLAIPMIVRFVEVTVRRKRKVNFNRYNVMLRDRYTCQYCGAKLATQEVQYDHVTPRSQGGATVWTNIVVCCHACNQHKAGRTPEQAGMRLLNVPVRPRSLPRVTNPRLLWTDGMPIEWRQYMTSKDEAATRAYWQSELT